MDVPRVCPSLPEYARHYPTAVCEAHLSAVRDIKPRTVGRKLTWRGFCAPFAAASELNDDKQAGIRYDVRAIAVKLANAAYMLKTCPADALAHLLMHLLRLRFRRGLNSGYTHVQQSRCRFSFPRSGAGAGEGQEM